MDFVAEGNTRFVLGSAAKHPHDRSAPREF